MTQPYKTDDLTPSDLQAYTNNRLNSEDANTALVLDAALQLVRNYCRWHVCPVITDDVVSLDGPGDWGGLTVGLGGLHFASGSYLTGVLRHQRVGANVLYLPTKRLKSITSIIEDGVALDMTTIRWTERGAVYKTTGQPWTYNQAGGSVLGMQGLEVTFTHGYSITEAQDWRRLVLACADRMSLVRGLIGPFNAAVGPYRVSALYGTSRTGTLPQDSGFLDDLLGMINTPKYVRVSA
jgi:hypothetical protein